MKAHRLTLPIVLAAAAATVLGVATPAAVTAPSVPKPGTRAACPPASPGHLRCFAVIKTRAAGAATALTTARPSGWGARSIEAAYKLPVSKGAGRTVAIVDAFNTPHLASYLSTYRKQYGLPPCGIASGCLRIVNQAGRSAPLAGTAVRGWDVETTLDVDMVSVSCPRCKILLVEARNDTDSNLAAAENTAARLGARVISNSYGARETGEKLALAKAYHHPGHVTVVASGDYGFTAASFPADLATVTAVGGTQLARAHNTRRFREKAWDTGGASGSGCSAYVARPRWQHGQACRMRTTADVSALAWNIPIFEKHFGGWITIGGTSAAAPLIAGVYALAGNAARIKPGYSYRHRGALFDVTTGSNVSTSPRAATCSGTAAPRYAATPTCAWPGRAMTRRPASEPRTGPAPSEADCRGRRGQAPGTGA